jgi:hypothetical protein
MAIKANPKYVSAHDNLGDVYSKLAANHYEKAVNLDNKNDSARSKLNMLSAIANLPIGSRQVYNGVASSAQAKQAFSFKSNTPNSSNLSAGGLSKQELEKQAKAEKLEKAEKAEKLEKAKLEKEQKLKAEKLEKSEKVEKAKKEVEAKPATSSAVVSNSPSKSAPTTSPTPTITAPAKTVATSSNAGDEQEVVKSVNSWASAWSNKNVGSYLGYYSSGFKPNDGSSRAAWEEARKTRIQDKGNIDVSVSNPKVTVSGDTATVTFKQVYKSDKLHDTTQKTLVMVKVNGKWQIKQEKGN